MSILSNCAFPLDPNKGYKGIITTHFFRYWEGGRVVALLFLFFFSSWTYAFSWQDIWMNSEQKAAQWMETKHYEDAARQFKHVDWQATAYYRAGDYKKAASLFGSLKTSTGFYNEGNALAHIGLFEKAIQAYDLVLKRDPNHQDARFNRDLVKKILEQKKQQQKRDNQQKSDAESKPSSESHSEQDNKQNQSNSDTQDQNPGSENKTKQDTSDAQKDLAQKVKTTTTPEPHEEKSKKVQSQQAKSQDQQEKQQAKEQWLRLIPEPPSSLLKQKFMRDYLKEK